MAMTNWASTQSDGTLPLTHDAGYFQYKHFISWFTAQAWGAGMWRVGKGTWHIQLIEPQGRVIFEQKVTFGVTLMFFGMMGIGILIWMYNENSEEITTTIVGGDPITDENPSWSYTLGNSPLSEFGILVPGGGESVINTVEADWMSPIYKMRVPVGTKLNVITDNWGLGVNTRPEWQFRFGEPAEGQVASAVDDYNQLYTVAEYFSVASDKLANARSWHPYHIPRLISNDDGKDPSIDIDKSGRVMRVSAVGSQTKVSQSVDAMRTWQDLNIQVPQGGTMPQVLTTNDGGYLAITKQGGGVFKYLRVNAGGLQFIGTFKGEGDTVTLAESNNGIIYVVNDKGVKIAASIDSGRTFGTEAVQEEG